MRESDIEDYLVKRVNAFGGEVRKVEWVGRRGAPDRIVMLPARAARINPHYIDPALTVWVELKAPGKKADAHQAREHERMRAMGQRVVVIDSLAGVDTVLEAR